MRSFFRSIPFIFTALPQKNKNGLFFAYYKHMFL